MNARTLFFRNLTKLGLRILSVRGNHNTVLTQRGSLRNSEGRDKGQRVFPRYFTIKWKWWIIYHFFNQTVKRFLINRSFCSNLLCLEFHYPFAKIDGINLYSFVWSLYPSNIYYLKAAVETCPKLTIKTPERRQWRLSHL